MKLIEKIKDRYNILLMILSFIFIIIILRLSYMTITKGAYYRDEADNSILREIRIDAPRGKIFDAYGRILATNTPTFTVRITKDDIKEENVNDIALDLISILEQENEKIEDDFPIQLNVIDYSDEKYYTNTLSLEEELVEFLKRDNNIDTLLDKFYVSGNYRFIVGKIAISILEKNGVQPPINIELTDNIMKYYYKEKKDIDSWKIKNKVSSGLNAKDSVSRLIKSDDKNIKELMKYPVIREEIYNLLLNNGLGEKFVLKNYDYTYDKDIRETKSFLIKNDLNVTEITSAKEDFAEIITNYKFKDSDNSYTLIIDKILSTIYEDKDNDGNVIKVIPGQILMNKLKEEGIEVPLNIDIQKSSNRVTYEYKDDNIKSLFLSSKGLNSISALRALIYLGNTNYIVNDEGETVSLIENIITSEEMRYHAQTQMIDFGLNPKISTLRWKYISEIKKESWIESIIKNEELDDYSAETIFNKLREKNEIPALLTDYEARFIFLFRQLLSKKNLRAYEPIDIASDVDEVTISKILESKNELIGADVSVVPTRFYPNGETAVHILGYLGRISSPSEIEKYKDNDLYTINDIVGESGIEHKFEEHLKGTYGTKKVEVDVRGRTKEVIEETSPIPGNNVFLTIDSKLQKLAEESLKKAIEEIQIGGEFESKWGNYSYKKRDGKIYKNATSGSIVAIDVKTGKVLALANYPSYDPNLFATGISTEDWAMLRENEDNPDLLAPRPLMNIALQSYIQPGSTFKMVTGLAALEKGIDPRFEINSRGFIEVGNRTFGDWQWNQSKIMVGRTNLYKALKDSVNYYFYTVSLGRNYQTDELVYNKLGQPTKVGIEDVLRIATEFGLDDKTGIEMDIPREESGHVPKPSIKLKQTKTALRRDLKNKINIKNYLVDKNIKTDDLNEIIEVIVSWTEFGDTISRGEVMNRLKNLGLNSQEPLPGKRENLTDIIKYSYLNQAGWKPGDTLNVSIGQGDNAYTPIQMANYTATLANDGYRNKVSVIDSLSSFNGSFIDKDFYNKQEDKEREEKEKAEMIKDYLQEINDSILLVSIEGATKRSFSHFPKKIEFEKITIQKEHYPKLIDIKNYKNTEETEETEEQKAKRIKSYLDEINKGMLLVSTEGTSRKAFGNFPVKVASKTGTAQKQGTIPGTNGEEYDNFGWFVAFAPYDDPQIAIAGLIFQGGSGGNVSPAAREIIAQYLGLNNIDEKVNFNNKLVE